MNAIVATRMSGRLRWHRHWVMLGALITAAVACVALMPAWRYLIHLALTFPAGDKWLHALSFAGLLLWWGNVYRHPRSRLAAAAVCLAFGLLIEFAQWPSAPDDADGFDVLADLAGLALALGLLRTPLGTVLAGVEARLGSGFR